MASPPSYPENVRRLKALASRRRTPKFAIGQLVREPHGEVGAIDAIYADLESVEEVGLIQDTDRWYAGLTLRPKTPKNGIWYSLIIPGGAAVAGEDDLAEAAS